MSASVKSLGNMTLGVTRLMSLVHHFDHIDDTVMTEGVDPIGIHHCLNLVDRATGVLGDQRAHALPDFFLVDIVVFGHLRFVTGEHLLHVLPPLRTSSAS